MASSTRTCYNRDGSPITDIAYQPCASDIERDSFCCGTNHQGAGHTNVADDVCESNGLCQNYEAFDGTNEGVKLWWRQGCTDPTWQSAECLGNICNESKWQDDNAPVRKCGENSWCCGDASCCSDTASLFALAAVAGELVSSTSSLFQSTSTVKSSIPASSSTNSATPSTPTDTVSSTFTPRTSSRASTTSPTADPPSSISNTSNSSQELSIAVRAGIGIGAAMIVILLVLVALLAWTLKKKRKQERRVTVELPQNPLYEKYQEMNRYPLAPPAELYAGNAAAEMGCRDPAELGIGRNMVVQEERPYGLDDPKVVLQP